MSSNTKTYKYKQTARQLRIQTREGSFANGVAYTDTPVTEGYSKVLMNYDINSTDSALQPRAGFQAQGIYISADSEKPKLFDLTQGFNTLINSTVKTADAVDSYLNVEAYKDKLLECVQYNTKLNSANLVLLKEFNRAQLSGTSRINNNTNTKNFAEGNISLVSPISNGSEDYYTLCTTEITQPNIHKQYCMTNLYTKKPVGCFAFNNTYYTFSNARVSGDTTKYVAEFTLNALNATITDSNSKDTTGQYLCFDEDTSNLCICKYLTNETTNTDTVEYVYIDAKTVNPEIIGDTISVSVSDAQDYLSQTIDTFSNMIPINAHTERVTVFDAQGNSAALRAIIKTISVKDFLKQIYTTLLVNTLKKIPNINTYNEAQFGQCVKITLTLAQRHSTESVTKVYYIFYTPEGVTIYDKLSAIPENLLFPQLHYFKNFDTKYMSDIAICRHKQDAARNNILTDFRIIPQQLNPSEAGTTGYNMLLDAPYAFTCEQGPFDILGVIPYLPDNKIALTPTINKDLILKCFYRAPTTDSSRRVTWEWREVGATNWTKLKDEIIDFSKYNNMPLECAFSSAVTQCIVRVTFSNPENVVTNVDGSKVEYVDAIRALGMNFITEADTSVNAETINYDLSTATGMLEWQSRLVLWGVTDAENIIFTSAVNNPNYFPYPNNIDILDEPVLHCAVYGKDLIVLTPTKLYRLVFDETGITWTKEIVQNNLHISATDIPMCQIIKNMLFFKSGNYYYMLVPKSGSLVGDTTIAPVSNTIKYFLDNFTKESKDILNKTYDNIFKDYIITDPAGQPYTKRLEDYFVTYNSYIDNTSMVLNYVYDYAGFAANSTIPTGVSAGHTDDFGWVWDLNTNYNIPDYNMYLILSLIYDTSTYTWRFKAYMTPRILTPIYINALSQNLYLYLTEYDLSSDFENTADIYKHAPCFVQVYKTPEMCSDNLITAGKSTNTRRYVKDFADLEDLTPLKNYQYLDTGYRILTSTVDFKKRFREVQFSLNNISQKQLTFYSTFLLDGNLRKDPLGYNTRVVYDEDNPGVGTLVVERPYLPADIIAAITTGNTTLNETFLLDNAAFPELAYWKVRVEVSGKGYIPRLQLRCTSEELYNIISLNWVYRTMNSR